MARIRETALREDEARHLLRRVAFAATPLTLESVRKATPRQAVSALIAAGQRAALPAVPSSVSATWTNTALQYEGMTPGESGTLRAAQQSAHREGVDELRRWWLTEMFASPTPLRENLTLFFHGVFGSASSTVDIPQALSGCNALLRREALGTVPALLGKLVLDPAMMIQIGMDEHGVARVSDRPAKLILDHWTVGPGAYGDRDVEELSRALTGWALKAPATSAPPRPIAASASRLQRRTGIVPTFDANEFDSEPKTILGTTRTFDARSAIELLAQHPATANRYAGLLVRYLGVDDPQKRLQRQVATTYLATSGSMEAMLLDIVTADEFWSDGTRWSLIKSPVHLLAGACRQLEMRPASLQALTIWLAAAGQTLFDTPNSGEGGWPDQEAWVTPPDRLAVRYQLGSVLAGNIPALGLRTAAPSRAATRSELPIARSLRAASPRSLLSRLDPAPGITEGQIAGADPIGRILATAQYQLA